MYFAVLIETIDYLGNKLPEALQLHYPNYQIGKRLLVYSVTRKKSPNVYKTCPKMIDFDTFTKNP